MSENKKETQIKKEPEKKSGSFFVAHGQVNHSGKVYKLGESIDVSSKDAERLIALGVIKEK